VQFHHRVLAIHGVLRQGVKVELRQLVTDASDRQRTAWLVLFLDRVAVVGQRDRYVLKLDLLRCEAMIDHDPIDVDR
jgi:hypothetical protein